MAILAGLGKDLRSHCPLPPLPSFPRLLRALPTSSGSKYSAMFSPGVHVRGGWEQPRWVLLGSWITAQEMPRVRQTALWARVRTVKPEEDRSELVQDPCLNMYGTCEMDHDSPVLTGSG